MFFRILPPNRPVHLTLDVMSNVSISSLEYVTMHIDVDVKPRGALTISLQSPSGIIHLTF